MAGLPDTAILGPGRCEVLILSEFYMKTYFGTPPARSETGFENLTEFRSRIDLYHFQKYSKTNFI
jgi:hypothetical protein